MSSLTFTQAVEAHRRWMMAANYSQHTLHGYDVACRMFLKHMGQDLPLAGISSDHVEGFMGWALHDVSVPKGSIPRPPKKRKPKTVLNYHIALSSLWTWALERGHVKVHVVRRVKRPKVNEEPIIPLTVEEMRRLLNGTRRTKAWATNMLVTNARPTFERDFMIIVLLWDTLIRSSELCQLKIADVHFDRSGGQLYIWGKGDKPRVVPFTKRTKKVMLDYLATRDGYGMEDLLVLNERGGPMTRDSLGQMIKRLGEKVGLRVSPHRIRTTGACHRVMNGTNIVDLQRMMGHSDVKTTMRYVKAAQHDPENVRRTSPVNGI